MGAQAVAATRLDLVLLGATSHRLIFIALLFAAVEAISWAARRERWRSWFLKAAWPVRWTAYYAGAALVFFYWNGAAQKFIYAKF